MNTIANKVVNTNKISKILSKKIDTARRLDVNKIYNYTNLVSIC